jgi:hypothetical protein
MSLVRLAVSEIVASCVSIAEVDVECSPCPRTVSVLLSSSHIGSVTPDTARSDFQYCIGGVLLSTMQPSSDSTVTWSANGSTSSAIIS